MELSLHPNICDSDTVKFSEVLLEPFEALSKELSNDYGGTIEHLWIDLELSKFGIESRPPRAFRFQKRVSGNSNLTGIKQPDKFNVGHYSVRPDFEFLDKLSADESIEYAIALIYKSTSVLLEKTKKLKGFNAERFRENFLSVCIDKGYHIDPYK